jgi:hypothetical protein
MIRRVQISTSVVAAMICCALGGGGCGPRPEGSGAPTADGKASPSARTPWGDPDLQGVWNDATSTPLQRPSGVAGKDVLGDEEAAEFQKDLAHNLSRDRRDGGPDADVNRAYNEHWMDSRRLKITEDRRTSLIVDPPDGRIPALVPLTPEKQKARAERAAAVARFNAGMPDAPEELSLPVRCVIRTDLPPYLPTIYNNDFQIYQSPGYVAIAPEMIHSARIIPLDGRPHLGKTSASGWGIRVATGRARRWSSRPLTSGPTRARRSRGPTLRPTASPNALHVSTPTRSTTNSLLRIRRPGRNRGRRGFPGPGSIRPSRCTSTRATKTITTSSIS